MAQENIQISVPIIGTTANPVAYANQIKDGNTTQSDINTALLRDTADLKQDVEGLATDIAGIEEEVDSKIDGVTFATTKNEASVVLGQGATFRIEPGTGMKVDRASVGGAPIDGAVLSVDTDVIATKEEVEEIETQLENKANTTEVNAALLQKANKATTLAGYGITDAYTKNELNNLITTPNQKYVTVATFASLPATGEADTIYRVSSYDGTQTDATKYAEYAWDGTAYILLSVKSAVGEVFDISAYNSNAKYTDLAAALGTNGANVPAGLRKGGMSVKFIKNIPAIYSVVKSTSDTQPTGTALDAASSIESGTYNAEDLTDFNVLPTTVTSAASVYYFEDSGTYTVWTITMATAASGEYVQYRLMSTAWSTVISDWQGVDNEPTAGSDNLVKSGGTIKSINLSIQKIGLDKIDIPLQLSGYKYNTSTKGIEKSDSYNSYIISIPKDVTSIQVYCSNPLQNVCGLFLSKPNLGDIGTSLSAFVIDTHAKGINFENHENDVYLLVNVDISGSNPTYGYAKASTLGYKASSQQVNLGIDISPYYINGSYVTNNIPYLPLNAPRVTTLNGWKWLILKVQAGDKFTFTDVFAGVSGARVYALYDKYGKQTSICDTASFTGEVEIVEDGYIVLNINTNQVHDNSVIVNKLTAFQDFSHEFIIGSLHVTKELKTSIQAINNTLVEKANKEDLDTIKENLEDMLRPYSPNLYNGSIIDGSIISTGGDLTTVPSWRYNKCTDLIPILPNKYYRISGSSLTTAYSIRCLKADRTTKMKVLAPSNGVAYNNNYYMPNSDGTDTAQTLNVQFKTPEDAAYIQFNIAAQSQADSGKVMLELVGDTYDPNFTPSEYKPYSEKHVIDEDYLPDEINNATKDIAQLKKRNFTLKVLLIGSSHGMNTIAQFPWIAYKEGFNIEVGNVYEGSTSLQMFINMIQKNQDVGFKYFKNGSWTTIPNKKYADVISYTDWDFISIQRCALDDEIWLSTQNEADSVQNSGTNIHYKESGVIPEYMSHTEALDYILKVINNNAINHPTILFNTGFADPSEGSGDSQTTNILTSINKMKEEFGIEYCPTATAIRNARNTFLRNYGAYNGHNLCYDSQHLDYGIGCYVVSATLFEFIFRRFGWSILTTKSYGSQEELITFISVAAGANYTEPTEDTMMVAKACAMAACNTPDEISLPLKERFRWQVSYNLSNGITASNTKEYSAEDDVYKTTLSGTITSVNVTMGGVDITSTAYNEGVVNIESVTGDVVITAS